MIQSAFWPAAPGTGAFIWVGMEAGILVAVVLVAPRAGALPGPVDLPARAGSADVSTGSALKFRPHRVVGTGCRMAELSRFQTLIAAIDSSRDESSFSS